MLNIVGKEEWPYICFALYSHLLSISFFWSRSLRSSKLLAIFELDTIYRDFLLADFLQAYSPHGHKAPKSQIHGEKRELDKTETR